MVLSAVLLPATSVPALTVDALHEPLVELDQVPDQAVSASSRSHHGYVLHRLHSDSARFEKNGPGLIRKAAVEYQTFRPCS